MKERRHFPRFHLRRVITYEAGILHERALLLDRKQFRALLLNISEGGLCIRSRHRIYRQTILRIGLPISQVSPAAPTLAVVSWVKKDRKGNYFRAGVRYII